MVPSENTTEPDVKPVTAKVVPVIVPAVIIPVVDRFSLPKEISPPEASIVKSPPSSTWKVA